MVFWERNGLRHGEFQLPDSEGLVVKYIEFSLDSSLLALHCINPETKQEKVLIFIRSNWKWFCKQVIDLDKPLATMKWCKKHQIFIIQNNGRFDFIEFSLNYHTSSSNYNHADHADLSYTAVIDYNNINLTPLGKFIMPPPMFEKQVTL